MPVADPAWWTAMAALDWAMLALGLAGMVLGVVLLARAKRYPAIDPALRSTPEEIAAADAAAAFGLPTRLATGLLTLFVSYHLIAWALPKGTVPFHVSARWWWAVVLAAPVLIAVSKGIDRWEAGR